MEANKSSEKVKLSLSDTISILNFVSSILLGVVTLIISINTYNNSLSIQSLSLAQDQSELRGVAYKIANTASLLRQNKPKQTDGVYIRDELLSIVDMMEKQLHNSALASNNELNEEWITVLNNIYFKLKFYDKLSTSNHFYPSLDKDIIEIDSACGKIFTHILETK